MQNVSNPGTEYRGPGSSDQPEAAINAGTTRRILIFNASPREAGHTASLLAPVADTVALIPGFSTDSVSLCGRTVLPCQDCPERCATSGQCWIEDDFAELAARWRSADGILLGAPVFTYGPPSKLYAFFQRLRATQTHDRRALPVPVGIVVQGGAEYSGAEITAQALLSLCLAAGCTPVAGDMPGSGQGVIGQVRDHDPSVEHLSAAASRLAARVCEMVKILAAGQEAGPVRLLLVQNGRAGAGREELLSGALATAGIQVEVDQFDFASATVAPCQACTQYCSQSGECIFKDDMQTFCSRWLQADAVAWLASASSVGVAPQIRAAIDRMNELRFETFFGMGQSNHMARYSKAIAIFGSPGAPDMEEASAQFLRHAALLYQNVLVPAGRWYEPVTSVRGQRLVALAATLKTGLLALREELPQEYYPSRTRLGQIDPDRRRGA